MKVLKGEKDSVGYCYVCEDKKLGGCFDRFPTSDMLKNHRTNCVAVHGEEEVKRRREEKSWEKEMQEAITLELDWNNVEDGNVRNFTAL
jgi:hypothetical protein